MKRVKLVNETGVTPKLVEDYLRYLREHSREWPPPRSGNFWKRKDGLWTLYVNDRAAEIAIWAPDGWQTRIPPLPSKEHLNERLVHTCLYCGKESRMEMKRVGFAGRACLKCHPVEVAKVEVDGWAN